MVTSSKTKSYLQISTYWLGIAAGLGLLMKLRSSISLHNTTVTFSLTNLLLCNWYSVVDTDELISEQTVLHHC